jgi:hypothetical protein
VPSESAREKQIDAVVIVEGDHFVVDEATQVYSSGLVPAVSIPKDVTVGGVLNRGLIAQAAGDLGTAPAVEISGIVSHDICNAGTILGGATAISVAGGQVGGSIVNTGLISGQRAGIVIKSAMILGDIHNAGTIGGHY